MRTATLMSVALLALIVAPVSAANIYFEQAEYFLPQNVTGYQVNMMASGGETVFGIELFLQVDANGPEIAVSELSDPLGGLIGPGLIFAGGDTPIIVWEPSDPTRIIYASTGTDVPTPGPPPRPGDPRIADGKLAILTFSTVGIAPGSYKLSPFLDDNASYFTDIAGDPLPTNLESTMLNVVPEPSAIVQILGLLGALPAVLAYRRWKAAR